MDATGFSSLSEKVFLPYKRRNNDVTGARKPTSKDAVLSLGSNCAFTDIKRCGAASRVRLCFHWHSGKICSEVMDDHNLACQNFGSRGD